MAIIETNMKTQIFIKRVHKNNAIVETYLDHPGVSLNSRKKKIKCTDTRPCKRIINCEVCRNIRRNYFISQGERFLHKHSMNSFVTVAWPLKDGEDLWSKLWSYIDRLAIGRSIKLSKYIRVIGIGEQNETPHLHFILQNNVGEKVRERVHKLWQSNRLVQIKDVTDPRNLLGYLFDKNFMVVFSRPDRPKRIRILSGSRGMSYGFPKYSHSPVAQGSVQ